MSYTNAFIRVSEDCPVDTGIPPVSGRDLPSVHMIQYELLAEQPYRYNHEDLLYEVHVRHKRIPEEDRLTRREEIWSELFAKSHPCLRASMLPKRYGWGIHYDDEGRIAIYAMESPEYARFTESADIKQLAAMRNKKRS